MTDHTPIPWMTQPCGELAPNDVMIVADCGKNSDGIQCISTVAKALSIRQTPETTKANADFIVLAVNNYERLLRRVTVLEMVIREELRGIDCHDEPNKMIVDDLHERFSVTRG